MESLPTLAKVCRFPEWVVHVPLLGKNATEAAGEYPEEFTDTIATKTPDDQEVQRDKRAPGAVAAQRGQKKKAYVWRDSTKGGRQHSTGEEGTKDIF